LVFRNQTYCPSVVGKTEASSELTTACLAVTRNLYYADRKVPSFTDVLT